LFLDCCRCDHDATKAQVVDETWENPQMRPASQISHRELKGQASDKKLGSGGFSSSLGAPAFGLELAPAL